MLLFGVPNDGLRHEVLRSIVQGQPGEALIRDLVVDTNGEPSPFLKRISADFSDRFNGQLEVLSFYERKLSPTIQVGPHASWPESSC